MPFHQNKQKYAAALFALLGIGYTLFNLHGLFTAPPERRVQFVPDDAFYYMVLARNYVEQGLWTFDSGVSLTTGFHPLHAYALGVIYSVVQPSLELFVGLDMLLSWLSVLPAMWLAVSLAIRHGRALPSALLLLFLLSRNVSLNMTAGVEWGWVVSIAAFYCRAFLGLGGPRHGRALWGVCVLGFLGSLARTDFGWLPAALAVASLPALRSAQGGTRLRGAMIGVAAASLGVLAGLVHNHWTTGQAVQSSAQMKSLWLATYGPSVSTLFYVIGCLFGEWTSTTRILIGLLTASSLVLGLRFYRRAWTAPALPEAENHPVAQSQEASLWFGCLVTLVGYIAFYALNPAAIQHWYTANFVVPLLLALALPLARPMTRGPASLGVVFSLLVLLMLLVRQVPQAKHFLDRPEWPHQISMYRAGHFLRDTPLSGPVGSWNAGIVGYYGGGHVINLDGLVNNDVYGYAVRGKLPEYIDAIGIQHIVDFERMLSEPDLRERGGYDSAEFLGRLAPVKRFENNSADWKNLTLFDVLPPGSQVPAPHDPDLQAH